MRSSSGVVKLALGAGAVTEADGFSLDIGKTVNLDDRIFTKIVIFPDKIANFEPKL